MSEEDIEKNFVINNVGDLFSVQSENFFSFSSYQEIKKEISDNGILNFLMSNNRDIISNVKETGLDSYICIKNFFDKDDEEMQVVFGNLEVDIQDNIIVKMNFQECDLENYSLPDTYVVLEYKYLEIVISRTGIKLEIEFQKGIYANFISMLITKILSVIIQRVNNKFSLL